MKAVIYREWYFDLFERFKILVYQALTGKK
jgi:hypothetical protein